MSDGCEKLLKRAFEKLNLSARATTRIIKVARTIADLDGQKDISENTSPRRYNTEVTTGNTMIEYSNVDALLILNAVEGLGLKRKHKLLSIAEPKDLLTDFDRYKPALLKILGTEVFGKLESLRTEETLEKEWDDLQNTT